MGKRKPLSKKIRFEVLKRDSFTCQYCGSKAPDVLLEVDHINPVKHGGNNSIMNLITACKGCNIGKSARKLSDDGVLKKQRKQIDDIAERRQQIEMMSEWRDSLTSVGDLQVNKLAKYWENKFNTDLCQLDVFEGGKKKLSSLIKQFDISLIYDAMDISFNHYVSIRGGLFDQAEVENAFNKIGGICHNKKYDIRGEFREIDSYIRTEYGMVYWKQAKLKKHLNELNKYYTFDRIVEICDFFMSDATFIIDHQSGDCDDMGSSERSKEKNDTFLRFVSMLVKDLKEDNIENYPNFISKGIDLITQGEE